MFDGPNPKYVFQQHESSRTYWEKQAAAEEPQLQAAPTNTNLQQTLVSTYEYLALYQLLTGQFALAENTLQRGLQLDSTKFPMLARIAPALLFQGKTEAALQEYRKWKDASLGNQSHPFFKEIFLADLRQLEEAGIIPEERKADVEMVRKMLGE